MTVTFTSTNTFTLTKAQYIASKVVADLRGMNAYYGKPPESKILKFYEELTVLLNGGYLASVEYGFKRNVQRVVTLYYEVKADGSLSDGKSGGVYARADIAGANWFSFLCHNGSWEALSPTEQQKIEARIPVKRTFGQAPEDGSGFWETDRSYSSDGVGTQRSTFRPD